MRYRTAGNSGITGRIMKKDYPKFEEWPAIAGAEGYRAKAFALALGMSRRNLEILTRKHFQMSPGQLLTLWWRKRVLADASRKTGAELLALGKQAHLSSMVRALKRSTGHGLRGLRIGKPKRLDKWNRSTQR